VGTAAEPVNYASLLAIAHQAVDLAAEMVRTRGPGVVTEKQERDLVSEADVAVEHAVRKHLEEASPEVGILGEEEGLSGGADVVWALDPVDGTANFVHEIPLCAVSLGLIDRGRPVVGVIDLPFLGSRYHAVIGEGAYRDDTPIRCRSTSVLSEAVVSVGDYAVGHDAGRKNEARLALTAALAAKVQRVRMFGSSAIDLAWVADGKTDASVMLSNKPWDTAAGVVIAREAGAAVVDAEGEPHTPASTSTIAATPDVLEELLAAMPSADKPM
jgi:myo-inositol-1(or 4)-monophosphatase